MSTADRAEFLAAIRENPDDDLPRLIYADWLDEHGEPERAEFIRLQCELARPTLAGRQRDELIDRQRDLLAVHGETWRPAQNPSVIVGGFVRGFIREVTVHDYSAFLAIAENLFASHPVYQLRAFRLRSQQLRSLACSPFLSSIHVLAVQDGSTGNNGVTVLARSQYLIRLSTLNVSNNRIGDVRVQTLSEAVAFATLRNLDLRFNRISDTGAEALAASSNFRSLRYLDLRGNPIGHDGQAILRARYGGAVKL